MSKSNKKKQDQLGMPIGTAQSRLRKIVLFHLIKKCGEDNCFRCGKKIETVQELSIEHKIPWLDNSIDLFWDIENIAFSHLSCNSGHGNRWRNAPELKHGTRAKYQKRGCRCDKCRSANARYIREYRIASPRGCSSNG